MNNNIFLTGDLHVGKTTLINKILEALPFSDIKGFRTSRYYKKGQLEGFYLENINDMHVDRKDIFIGKCINQNCWVSIPSTFDEYGTEILQGCIKEQPKLIVMDELGFFENEALVFQSMVSSVLDSEIPVLGVLKKKETPFLDMIKNREDVSVFTVTEKNREEMYPIIIKKIKDTIQCNKLKSKLNINAREFDKTAKKVFAPVYQTIAKQIKDKTQITNGVCLDIGTGTGYLGIEVAKTTSLQVYLLDKSQDMLDIANKNIINADLNDRVRSVLGDVHKLPFKDGSVDLVTSRGSLYFWEDKKRAFKEIQRVLAPGGIAYIGGGFGTADLKRKIDIKMQKIDKHWRKNMTQKVEKTNINYHGFLESIKISNFQIIKDEANMWIIIRKEANENVVTA